MHSRNISIETLAKLLSLLMGLGFMAIGSHWNELPILGDKSLDWVLGESRERAEIGYIASALILAGGGIALRHTWGFCFVYVVVVLATFLELDLRLDVVPLMPFAEGIRQPFIDLGISERQSLIWLNLVYTVLIGCCHLVLHRTKSLELPWSKRSWTLYGIASFSLGIIGLVIACRLFFWAGKHIDDYLMYFLLAFIFTIIPTVVISLFFIALSRKCFTRAMIMSSTILDEKLQ